ncbi:hypothetical protein AMJ44_13840 [candidate division WOR-1 bacterium DG_54_3]|uniref:Damage-control phosphatase ARMT1-like metal-binding domain-containing protein n=1 Tax=candidate division WOR-1 bacterium DG_54_3 TaxID=1703775 RepID=A0A0S7XP64_UNCSA|nr:MAG: hypothetical protein AMJ44_13840 [candidate division WOR-1 bacterium DG_54_3]ODS38817.1 MAG: hypothetical protein A7315_11805 [Candidatus Altiarchaeales archaeon WOR_SM1_79]
MRVHLDCIPCFQRQALDAARFITDDEKMHENIIRAVIAELQGMDWKKSPPEIAHVVHKIIRDESGVEDPYKDVKKYYNDITLKMYPELKKTVNNSATPLLTAVRLAIAGNVIDFGAKSDFDLNETISLVLKKDFKIYHFSEFVRSLEKANNILYLADNAGEIVFDRILLETIFKEYNVEKTLFALKGAPIINDATYEDAKYVGINNLKGLEFIKVGVGIPGTGIERTSNEFQDVILKSDIVISKGQGNYEALSELRGIFFLLMAKCPVIAEDLGVKVGDIILKGG